MTATASLRAKVVHRLKDRLTNAAPPGVAVTRGVDRDRPTDQLIAIADITSVEVAVATMKRGRQHYNDTFTVELFCIAWEDGTDDFAAVDAAAEALGELVRNELAEHPQLDDDGGNALAGLRDAVLTTADGPNPFRTDTGVASAMRLEVTATTRIA